jgi:hypothetical protein
LESRASQEFGGHEYVEWLTSLYFHVGLVEHVDGTALVQILNA